MSLTPDNLLERVKLKSEISKWRALAILFVALSALLAFSKIFDIGLSTGNYIARVTIDGLITTDRKRDELIASLAKDDNVQGVIVSIDSPGGTLVGGEALYEALLELNESKPVAAVLGNLAASGGYMAAIATDYIVARSGTLTGSIGVMLQTAEFTELSKKLGVNFITFKSGDLKGSPSPFEKLNPKVRRSIQSSIDVSFNMFVDMVASRRSMDKDAVLKLADGRVFTGIQALENNLVDALGGERVAVDWLQKERGLQEGLPIVDKKPKKTTKGFLEDLYVGFFGDPLRSLRQSVGIMVLGLI